MRYKLNAMVKKPKGSQVKLQPTRLLIGPEEAYKKAMRAMLVALAREVRLSIIPQYQRDKRYTTDAANDSWFAQLRALSNALIRTVSDTAARILNLEAQRHTKEFPETVRKAIGIDVSALVRRMDVNGVVEAGISRNVQLITSLANDTVRNIERVVIDNSLAGNSVKTLREQLQKQFHLSDNRAQLIARDQMGKFHADLDQYRQAQAGIAEYDWLTSHDERVRPLHRSLDGKRYKWGQKTGAEDGLPPGKPIQCRCRAQGIIVW